MGNVVTRKAARRQTSALKDALLGKAVADIHRHTVEKREQSVVLGELADSCDRSYGALATLRQLL